MNIKLLISSYRWRYSLSQSIKKLLDPGSLFLYILYPLAIAFVEFQISVLHSVAQSLLLLLLLPLLYLFSLSFSRFSYSPCFYDRPREVVIRRSVERENLSLSVQPTLTAISFRMGHWSRFFHIYPAQQFSSFIQPRLNLFFLFRFLHLSVSIRSSSFVFSFFFFFFHQLKFDFPSSFLYSSVYHENSHSNLSGSQGWETKYHLSSQLGPILSFMRIFVLDSYCFGYFHFRFRFRCCPRH